MIISSNRIGNYKLLVGRPGAGDWIPPPEGFSTIPGQVNSIQSSETPLATSPSSRLLPRSREYHPNSIHVLENLDSSSEQISLTEHTTLKKTLTNPNRQTHQNKTTNTVKGLPPQKPVDPEKLSEYNHKYSENSIFYDYRDYDLDDIMNPSASPTEQREVLKSQAGSKKSNKQPLSLSGSEEDNKVFKGENTYPKDGNGVEQEYFADDNDTLDTSSVNDTNNVVAEYWKKLCKQENISNIFRQSYIDQQQTKNIKLSHNIGASDEINDKDVWNSSSENYNNSWESIFWERLNTGNGEREGNKEDTVPQGELSESGHIGDTTFRSEKLTDEEQIHQLMKALGIDKADIRLYNLAGKIM